MYNCIICNEHLAINSCHLICCCCAKYFHTNCLHNINQPDLLHQQNKQYNWICTVCTANIFPFNNIDDDEEYMKCITENVANKRQLLSVLDLQNISLDLFELSSDDDITLIPLTTPDPDKYFYNVNSNY